ncbi:hypothetical protein EDC65_2267 [Stella humosa]|uniref:Uncharacterized protein n=1 Tax=Stella humosa TaxID=94 RepID=A0A3N1MA05_9PROT|nr:hypothetical protein [Stella humosa]ROQ00468.1 hypothetical protein EDC65_2267 [Stella humosa]BBK30287.1 hypothetical protein STHU_09210 [Stella humosa]
MNCTDRYLADAARAAAARRRDRRFAAMERAGRRGAAWLAAVAVLLAGLRLLGLAR